jgi:hypothetical protein
VRVKYLGLRNHDRAKIAYIEYIRNPIELYENNEKLQEREKTGLPSFWEWELKILQQEIK